MATFAALCNVQNLKIPLKSSSFACETDFIFLEFFTVVCGLYHDASFDTLEAKSYQFITPQATIEFSSDLLYLSISKRNGLRIDI